MLTVKRSAGVEPVMNLSNSLHTDDEVQKWGIHSFFKTQGEHHQKYVIEVSVAPQKRMASSKN